MSTDDERYVTELRGSLGIALDEISPSAAPLLTVKRQGKRIRVRRRVGVAAALAVAVAVGALAPGLVRDISQTQPTTHNPKPPRVTIGKVSPGKPRGIIAKGTINGKPWQITMSRMGKSDLCSRASGDLPSGGCGPINSYHGIWPAMFVGTGDGRINMIYGTVAAPVTRLTLTLSDGAELSLRPVTFAKWRWIGVELPAKLAVVRAVAYSRTGELASTIPFTASPGALPSVRDWQRPGEPVPGQFTKTIGSGVSAGERWSVAVHVGPWGRCVTQSIPGDSGNVGCWSSKLPQRSGVIMGSGDLASPSHLPSWVVVQARSSVSYVQVVKIDGSTSRIPVVQVGNTRLFVIVVVKGPVIASWSAYDAAGHRLYGGSGAPGYAKF